MTVRTRFVGIGVGDYRDPTHQRLDRAVPEIREVHRLLGADPSDAPLINPTKAQVEAKLESLPPMTAGGSLVLVWSGHGVQSPEGGLRLLTSDSGTKSTAGILATEVVGPCAESGANQLLVVLDTCFSGEGVPAATEVATAVMALRPPQGRFIWVGVLASCMRWQTARDGLFGERLQAMIVNGPVTSELRRPWSQHNQFLRGDHICDALMREWATDVQSPVFRSDGVADWLIANPLYVDGAPAQVVEHLRLAARGGDDDETPSWFAGRGVEVGVVVAWLLSEQPGLRVVTGSAGTGKSAIVGRVVSAAHPTERQALLRQGAFGHPDPGEGSVSAHAHARGRTADQLASQLDGHVVAAGVLEPDPSGARNAAQLVGALQKHAESGQRPPVLVIDGLDEARGYSFTIARDLVVRLAPHATVIVSTRDIPEPGKESPRTLLEVLSPDDVLDLDAPGWSQSGREAMREYLTARLSGKDPAMDNQAVADHLTGSGDAHSEQPFLLARLVGDQLCEHPIDTSTIGWQAGVASTIYAAVDADLDDVPEPGHRVRTDGVPPARFARLLLTALTWGLGAGFPEEEWTATATTLCSPLGLGEVGPQDVSWAFEHLGRYLVQAGEGGVAVYRVAHQSLADHLRPPFLSTSDETFDSDALPVADALIARYRALLDAGIAAGEADYLWHYVWRHATLAGGPGLALLRRLADSYPQLRSDVAMAAVGVAETLAEWGHRADALSAAQEAVELDRELAATDPEYLPHLAMALSHLGIRLYEVGRWDEALSLTRESVDLYRRRAADDPALLPPLAAALNNLGIHSAAMGERAEALTATQEALDRYRLLAQNDPALLSDLAMSLTSLGIRLAEMGQRSEALSLTQEGVDLYRQLAQANPAAYAPAVAGALTNLGNRLAEMGQRTDALEVTKEAVNLYRRRAAENSAFRAELAIALNNLGIRFSELGRTDEALPVAQEAVDLDRELASDNPAYAPDLAMALANLGNRLSAANAIDEALSVTQEAVGRYRGLAETNASFGSALSRAISSLGIRFAELGRWTDALSTTQEAVHLSRRSVADNPAHLPDLAGALNNLGLRHSELGQSAEALAVTQESVDIYRTLAADNPAFRPDLARSLATLAIHADATDHPAVAFTATQDAVDLYRKLAEADSFFLLRLASALIDLGNRFSRLGESDAALPAAKEAVDLCRQLVAVDSTLLPELARALTGLSACLEQSRQLADALVTAREAVELCRQLAVDDPSFGPRLAGTLSNLGARYAALGQPIDAQRAAAEAVDRYRSLAAADAGYVIDLAMALGNLDTYCSALGKPEHSDAAWTVALGDVDRSARPVLLMHRSLQAEAGAPEAAAWLAESMASAHADGALTRSLRDEVRRHRRAGAAGFDSSWRVQTGDAIPDWAAVDMDLLDLARGWVGAASFTDEHDFLIAHPELLEATSDGAIEEALFDVTAVEQDRYRDLRQKARIQGTTPAYRQLLLSDLVHRFAAASIAEQRELLRDRPDDFLDNDLSQALAELAEHGGTATIQRAQALASLAGDRTAVDLLAAVFDALENPPEFRDLLHQAARRTNPDPLDAIAQLALFAATTDAQAAEAALYASVAATLAGDDGRAVEALTSARARNPDARDAWIREVNDIGRIHPKARDLIDALLLANPAETAEGAP